MLGARTPDHAEQVRTGTVRKRQNELFVPVWHTPFKSVAEQKAYRIPGAFYKWESSQIRYASGVTVRNRYIVWEPSGIPVIPDHKIEYEPPVFDLPPLSLPPPAPDECLHHEPPLLREDEPRFPTCAESIIALLTEYEWATAADMAMLIPFSLARISQLLLQLEYDGRIYRDGKADTLIDLQTEKKSKRTRWKLSP